MTKVADHFQRLLKPADHFQHLLNISECCVLAGPALSGGLCVSCCHCFADAGDLKLLVGACRTCSVRKTGCFGVPLC